MTNGATGPLGADLLLVNSGRGNLPPSVTLVNPDPPHNVTVLVDNFFGRQFNSLNDVKIHPKTGSIFFTDVTWAFVLGVGVSADVAQVRVFEPLSPRARAAEPGLPPRSRHARA